MWIGVNLVVSNPHSDGSSVSIRISNQLKKTTKIDLAMDELTGWDWYRITQRYPVLIDTHEWASMTCEEMRDEILKTGLQIADDCEWSQLTGWDWVALLLDFPQLSHLCD